MPCASLIHGADVVLSQNSIDAKPECFFAKSELSGLRQDARISAEVARGLRQIRLNLRVVDVAKSFRINGEPGWNRTHNPQIKSSLPHVKTLKELNDFSRQPCRTLQIAATRRNPDATE